MRAGVTSLSMTGLLYCPSPDSSRAFAAFIRWELCCGANACRQHDDEEKHHERRRAGEGECRQTGRVCNARRHVHGLLNQALGGEEAVHGIVGLRSPGPGVPTDAQAVNLRNWNGFTALGPDFALVAGIKIRSRFREARQMHLMDNVKPYIHSVWSSFSPSDGSNHPSRVLAK